MRDIEHLPLISAIYAAAIYLAFVLTSAALLRARFFSSKLLPGGNRYGGIDGLRGLLAVAVFTHHTVAAYGYFTTGRWGWSEHSALFNHFGQTGVALFFMVTAFLFTRRLMGGNVIWRSLYISRAARLVPLYLVFMGGVMLAAAQASSWEFREPIHQVAKELAHWFAFVVIARPDINGTPLTWTQGGGVAWSLAYEWYFYAALPLLSLALVPLKSKKTTRIAVLAFACILFVEGCFYKGVGAAWHLYALQFACGAAVALLYRDPAVRRVISMSAFRWFGLACLLLLLAFMNSYGAWQLLLIAVFFASVVGAEGGILHTKPLLWLGEISYGVYLLHALILYQALLNVPFSLENVSIAYFSAFMMLVGAGVVVVASGTHVLVERPGIRLGKAFVRRHAATSASRALDRKQLAE